MIYVALLRGINVGGKNKISMKELAASFRSLGLSNVKTYINSGNIIFTNDSPSEKQLISQLEQAILRDFSLSVKVLLRSFHQFREMMDDLPDEWENDKEQKSDVLFLWDEIDQPSVIEKIPVKPDLETLLYSSGALLWNVDRKNQTRSGLQKLPGTELYKQMTIRNVNTVRKIFRLMEEII